MLVHLGPVDAPQMEGWLRFARRLMCDLRTEPGDMDSQFAKSLLNDWCDLVDDWAAQLNLGEKSFSWRGDLEPDKAEFLLHSLERALHSATVAAWVTEDDLAAHGVVTFHIMQRFIESLEGQGSAHAEYVEQLRTLVGRFAAKL